jgi:hypothetical protein
MNAMELAKLMGLPRDTDMTSLLIRAALTSPAAAEILTTRSLRFLDQRRQAIAEVVVLLQARAAA